MRVHKDESKLTKAAKASGLVVRIANVKYQLAPTTIAQLIVDDLKTNGFTDYVFYWPPNPVAHSTWKNNSGYFYVEFKNRVAVENFVATFQGKRLEGRELSVSRCTPVALSPVPISSSSGAVAETDSTSTFIPPSLGELDSLPRKWILDPKNPDLHREEFFEWCENLERKSQMKHPVNQYLITKDSQGRPKFHSRQYPSPNPLNDQFDDSVFVYVVSTTTSKDGTSAREYRRVKPDWIDALSVDGWVVWDHPDQPRYPYPDHNRDPRQADWPQDVYTTNNPANDDKRRFPHAIKILEANGVSRDWKLGLGNLLRIDLVEQPAPETVANNIEKLIDFGFLNQSLQITGLGKLANDLPLEPIWSHAISMARKCNCVPEIMTIAALESCERSIFIRPRRHADVADLVKTQFANPLSDHITAFNAYVAYAKAIKVKEMKIEAWCKKNFLDHDALKQVDRMRLLLSEHIQGKMNRPIKATAFADPEYHTNIRKALALTLYHNAAAMKRECDDQYQVAVSGAVGMIHPRSALVGGGHEWIVYSKLVVTNRPYCVTVTAIDPAWLVDLE